VPPTDYEIYRQRLEEQLRADVELLYEAYRAKLRAYETVLRTRAEIGAGPWPPPELPLSLPPAPGLEKTAPAPAMSPKRPRSKAYSVIDAVEGVLGTLDDVFDRNDLIRSLGFEPNRATLHRVLSELTDAGVIAVEHFGGGKQPNLYRRIAPVSPPGKGHETPEEEG
jgi:hypothetical protein